jgi:hypothetical protein
VPTYGADPESLDALAHSMAIAAETFDRIGAEVGARVHSAPWRGSAADSFRQRWTSTYYPALLAAHAELSGGARVGALDPFLTVVGLGFSAYQLDRDITHPGSFANMHRAADGFGLAGGVLMTASAFVPPPADAVVFGAGIVCDGVGYGIDEAVQIWDQEGGRQVWNTVEPWATHELDAAGSAAWNTAYSTGSGAVHETEHVASGAWHAVSGWL